jgi:hypothetical protein
LTPIFILWLVPGFIVYFLKSVFSSSRRREGWEAVFSCTIYAGITSVLARFSIVGCAYLFNDCGYFNQIRHLWHILFPIEHSSTVALACLYALLFPFYRNIAFLAGSAIRIFIASDILAKIDTAISNFAKNIADNSFVTSLLCAHIRFSDPYYAFMSAHRYRIVLITMKSGKIYVGLLVAYSNSADEAHRTVRFTPLLSGQRDEKTGEVAIYTDYRIAFSFLSGSGSPMSSNADVPDILVSYSEIASIARHDLGKQAAFEHCNTWKWKGLATQDAEQKQEQQPMFSQHITEESYPIHLNR